MDPIDRGLDLRLSRKTDKPCHPSIAVRADIGYALMRGLPVSQLVIVRKDGVIKALGDKALGDKEKISLLVGGLLMII